MNLTRYSVSMNWIILLAVCQLVISTAYGQSDQDKDEPQEGQRSYGPAKHKVGLSGQWTVIPGWHLNTNYLYRDTAPNLTPIPDIPSKHRFDMMLATHFAEKKGELLVGVTDAFINTTGPHFSSGPLSAYELPGRTWVARLQYTF